MKTPRMPAYFKSLFDRYKYILLVCLVGVILMIWPQDAQTTTEKAITDCHTLSDGLEGRIQAILEEMDGVGKAQVLLTVENGGRLSMPMTAPTRKTAPKRGAAPPGRPSWSPSVKAADRRRCPCGPPRRNIGALW